MCFCTWRKNVFYFPEIEIAFKAPESRLSRTVFRHSPSCRYHLYTILYISLSLRLLHSFPEVISLQSAELLMHHLKPLITNDVSVKNSTSFNAIRPAACFKCFGKVV